jgi:hypothetical protein
MQTRRIVLGALAAPLLLLPACGGHDASVADPPVAPSTSSPPDPPKRETPEHFIRRWAAAEKKMENTGNTRAYLSMSQGCSACSKLANEVARFYAAGGYIDWGGWRITGIRVNSRNGHEITYAVRNRSLPTSYRESSSGPEKRLPGGVSTELLALERTTRGWQMRSKAELAS